MSLLGKMLGFGRNAHYDKGIRYFDQGLYEEAVNEFDLARHSRSVRSDSLTDRLSEFYAAESYAHLGHAALKLEQWERAEKFFAHALEIHPDYADLHFYYALAVRASGRFQEARNAIKKALDINPRFAKAHFYLGLISYQLGSREEGLHSLEHALELDPGFHTEVFEGGMRYDRSGDFDAALRAFEQVSHTEVDDILFHCKLGNDMFGRKMYEEAIAEYEKALVLNPNYADIRNNLGEALVAAGKSREAIAEFRRALHINPNFIDAMINLAVELRDTGAPDEAAELFEQAIGLEPDNAIARANLGAAFAGKARKAA